MILVGSPRLVLLVAFHCFINAALTRSKPFLERDSLASYIKSPSEIEDYDIFEPTINYRGRYTRSIDDRNFSPQVTFRAFGEDYQLDLVPAPRFYRPDLEIEYVDEGGTITKKPLRLDDCFYHGHVTSHNASTVAVSICNGLMRGMFAHNNDTIYVTPLTKAHAQDFSRRYKRNSDNIHLIYKRNVDDGKYCDVEPPASFTAFTELTSEDVEAMNNAYVPPKFLEMCVILDKDFISKHTPDHAVYALTLLNIVSRRYSEPSLAVIFRIYIVRIITIASDTPTVDGYDFTIDANDVIGTLASLRSWSRDANPSGDNDPGHWDNLLTFSGKDLISATSGSSLLGIAYIGGTCLDELGISLNEDFGLTTGIVTSHEVGHTLTLLHDQDEGCDPGYVMGSSISNGQNIFKWSNCSRINLMSYLSTVPSACLDDAPSTLHSPLVTTNLPGETTSWEEQCILIGATATCGTLDCGQLKCMMGGSCISYNSHALAEGTACGINMICLAGECVNVSSVPLPVDGGWSAWSETPCSRTCGGGIIIRERVCNNPFPAYGGLPCEGEGFESCMCNNDIECLVSPDDYRDEQCAATAGEPAVDGGIYGWTEYFRPFLSFSDYCQNPCLRSDNRFYERRPPGLNTDGTECWDYNIADESRYLRCVRGYCLTFGCDGRENSSSEYDVCRVCNGDGSSCTCVNGSFSAGTTGQFNNWHDIPSGATSILITNNDVARGNHVAIVGLSSGFDYFRGTGSNVDSDIRTSLQSFIIRHEHSSTSEMFRGTGPTPESLRLEVYLTASVQPNLVSYTYCVANPGKSYFWDISDYGDCSETCNGTKVRSVTCVEVNNGSTSVVDDSLCGTNVGTKPDTVTDCNVHVCPFWVAGDFGNCTVICGNGTQTRNVSCRMGSQIVNDSLCESSPKPPTEQSCNVGSCRWVVGQFGECSVTCGVGTQMRDVQCQNDIQIVNDGNCEETKPDRERSCDSGDCAPYWNVESFSRCSTNCGKGVRSREVTCRVGTTVINTEECDASTRPSDEEECISSTCPRACDMVFIATDEDRSGTFSTPRFPRRYRRRSRCSTWIFAEEGKSVKIIFRRFLLQANQRRGCKYDYLLVTDLITGRERRYCGNRGRFIVTYNHEVMLYFRSNDRRNFRGFKARFVVS